MILGCINPPNEIVGKPGKGFLESSTANSGFECPCHLSEYDLNGKVTRQPVNTEGSSTDLPTYTTAYDSATDTLTIT